MRRIAILGSVNAILLEAALAVAVLLSIGIYKFRSSFLVECFFVVTATALSLGASIVIVRRFGAGARRSKSLSSCVLDESRGEPCGGTKPEPPQTLPPDESLPSRTPSKRQPKRG